MSSYAASASSPSSSSLSSPGVFFDQSSTIARLEKELTAREFECCQLRASQLQTEKHVTELHRKWEQAVAQRDIALKEKKQECKRFDLGFAMDVNHSSTPPSFRWPIDV